MGTLILFFHIRKKIRASQKFAILIYPPIPKNSFYFKLSEIFSSTENHVVVENQKLLQKMFQNRDANPKRRKNMKISKVKYT
jgi:hypothetical protein